MLIYLYLEIIVCVLLSGSYVCVPYHMRIFAYTRMGRPIHVWVPIRVWAVPYVYGQPIRVWAAIYIATVKRVWRMHAAIYSYRPDGWHDHIPWLLDNPCI